MTHRLDVATSRDLAGRWCALAEQRLEYLTEMFESGRWRRFHSEHAFLENIKEAKFAVEMWRNLSMPELAKGIAAVELTFTAPAVAPAQLSERQLLAITPEAPETGAPEKDVGPEEYIASETVAVAPIIDMLALEQALDNPEGALDMTAIERRYPLLRNAL
jgi:hypothetical protein